MNTNFPNDLPIELINEINKWGEIKKSPYSNSYYNSNNIGWNYKPDNSFRVSDHWNFSCKKGKIHCKTTIECPNNTHWSIGVFNSDLGKYTILKSYPKSKNLSKETLIYRLDKKRIFTLDKIDKQDITDRTRNKVLSDIELNYLNSYYRILQNFNTLN